MPTSRTTAPRDENGKPTLLGIASTTVTIGGIVFTQNVTPVPIAVNPTTHAILLETS